MMKQLIFTGALILVSAVTGEATADCATNQVLNLNGLLLNNTVCDRTAAYDNVVMGMQEEHRSGDKLWDYKKGSS